MEDLRLILPTIINKIKNTKKMDPYYYVNMPGMINII